MLATNQITSSAGHQSNLWRSPSTPIHLQWSSSSTIGHQPDLLRGPLSLANPFELPLSPALLSDQSAEMTSSPLAVTMAVTMAPFCWAVPQRPDPCVIVCSCFAHCGNVAGILEIIKGW